MIRYKEEREKRGWEKVEHGWWCNVKQSQGICHESDDKWHVWGGGEHCLIQCRFAFREVIDLGAFKTLRAAIEFADAVYDRERT